MIRRKPNLISNDLDDLENDLDGSLAFYGLKLDYELYPGYYDVNGAIHAASAQSERYTLLIPVEQKSRVYIRVYSQDSYSQWIAYASFDENQNYIGRTVLISNQEINEFEDTILVNNSDIKYLSFMYRSFANTTGLRAFIDIKNANLNHLDERFLRYDSSQTLSDNEKDIVRTNIGVSSKNEVDDLKNALVDSNIFVSYTWSPGYYNLDGSIHAQSAQHERYTSLIPVVRGSKIQIHVYSETEHSQWIAYAAFDENQNIIGRYVLVSNKNISDFEYTLLVGDENIKYVSIMYRGYFVSGEYTVSADISNVTLTKMSDGSVNLFNQTNALKGVYISASNTNAYNYNPRFNFKKGSVAVTPNDTLHCRMCVTIPRDTTDGFWLGYNLTDGDTVVSARTVISDTTASGYVEKAFDVSVPEGATVFNVSARFYEDGLLSVSKNNDSPVIILSPYDMATLLEDTRKVRGQNPNVRAINHRGFNYFAPENTLPAFELSAKMGFEYVETDVWFTSDGVPVLIHDNTINRTGRNSDGTEISESIRIDEITYNQALSYDFGIYKNEYYANTKIPTLEEFLSLCKYTGLKAYIELKGGTESQIHEIVDLVYRYGMNKSVTYIGFSLLNYIPTYDPSARLGLICDTITDSTISTVEALKTEQNEVFIDSSRGEGAAVDTAIAKRIPIEVWQYGNTDKPYIVGYTTDISLPCNITRRRYLYN